MKTLTVYIESMPNSYIQVQANSYEQANKIAQEEIAKIEKGYESDYEIFTSPWD